MTHSITSRKLVISFVKCHTINIWVIPDFLFRSVALQATHGENRSACGGVVFTDAPTKGLGPILSAPLAKSGGDKRIRAMFFDGDEENNGGVPTEQPTGDDTQKEEGGATTEGEKTE